MRWPRRPGPRWSRAELREGARRVAEAGWWGLPALDARLRSTTLSRPGWCRDWQLVGSGDVAALADRSRRPVLVAGLLSMHHDGHVREAAVGLLAEAPTPDALPFLVVRASDWVEPVRRRAQIAVDARLAGLDPATVARALPLVDRMAAADRRGASWHAALRSRLVGVLGRDELVAALGAPDLRLRRVAAMALAEQGELDLAVVDAAAAQRDPVTLRRIGMAALARGPDPDATAVRLATASDPVVRAHALHHRLGALPGAASDGVAREGLLDRSPRVRGVAQRHLSHRGVDVAGAYRALLPEGPIAVQGLGEVGSAADAATVRPLVADPRPPVRAAALRAWCRLDPHDGRAEALAALVDPEPAVATVAGRLLRHTRLGPAAVDRLWGHVVADERPHDRRAVLHVLRSQDRWLVLVVAQRALRTGDPELAGWAEGALSATAARWNQVATGPAPTVLAELRRLVADPATPLAPGLRAELADRARPW